MSSAPIGVFDSGIGGLSILRGIQQILPQENLLYLADSAHAPYGPKGETFIRARSQRLADYLLSEGAKALVVACNTATAAAIADLRARYRLPIIGVEPAIKPAAEQSLSRVVGVLATSGTIASDKFIHLHDRFSDRVQILTRAGTGLVELIEQPEEDPAALQALLQQYIAPMREQGMDTLVLGCTHYSLIRAQIEQVAGTVRIVDAGTAVARELARRLADQDLLTRLPAPGQLRFLTSGAAAVQRALLQRYWHQELVVEAPTGLA